MNPGAVVLTSEVRRTRSAAVRIGLLDGFVLEADGSRVRLPQGPQRLIAFLAIHGGPVPRSRVASRLWLERTEERAQANLRSALWRLSRAGVTVADAENGHLRLADHVAVDVRETVLAARRLLHPDPADDVTDLDEAAFTGELLPDWYDDWVIEERERLRQLCLHALEVLGGALLGARRFGRAVEVALAAVRGEPLRESAHRLLIEIHLAEGNRSEAVRQYERYRRLLGEELGLPPSADLRRLVEFGPPH